MAKKKKSPPRKRNNEDTGPSFGWAVCYFHGSNVYLEMTIVADEKDHTKRKFRIFGSENKKELIKDLVQFYQYQAQKSLAWKLQAQLHIREFRPRIVKLPSKEALLRDYVAGGLSVWTTKGKSGDMFGVMLTGHQRVYKMYYAGFLIRPSILEV